MTRTKPLSGRRLLIVEDKYLIAQEMRLHLEALGGEVVAVQPSVSRAEQALGLGVDLAFLDVNLDSEPVFPLAARLAAERVPFIFVTGYDRSVLPPEWRERPHVEKPVSRRALEDAVVRAGLGA